MKKNMFKRAWLNITRKKNKSIILIIIMFVIANLVLASLAISNSVEESTAYAKKTLGSEVYLNADMEKIRSEMTGMMGGQNSNSMENADISSMAGMISRPEINIDMVEQIAQLEYVKDYTYSITASYEPVNFELIEVETNSFGGRENFSMGNMITGINSYAFVPGVTSGQIEITEGTYFDETTTDSLIISYELAEENELAVGDILELQNTESEEVFEYEIIGIFLASEEGYENSIYMNIESTENLLSEEMYNNGDYSVSSVIYYLNNPELSEEFIEEANTFYDFESLNLTLDIDNSAYEQMAGPLESVGSFATTIMIVVIIAAVLIIALIINNNIKDRKYEMGVLMSLGATKLNILGQILIELVVVATVGFILSMATSSIIASGLSSSLLESQLEMDESQSENNFGRPTVSGGGMPGGMTTSNNSDVEVIDEIDVSVSLGEYGVLFVVGYLIVIMAMSMPAINIMKYEPKTILTGRE